MDVATETARYLFPKRLESRTLEEALMAGSKFLLLNLDLQIALSLYIYLHIDCFGV